jgi:hypothetical protein
MRLKSVLSVLLSLAAVAVPVSFLWLKYGQAATVDGIKDILVLFGTTGVSAVLGLSAGVLLRGTDRPMLLELVNELLDMDRSKRRRSAVRKAQHREAEAA